MAAKYHSRSKKNYFIWSKIKDLEGNSLQTTNTLIEISFFQGVFTNTYLVPLKVFHLG
jgi:hypothetical protein